MSDSPLYEAMREFVRATVALEVTRAMQAVQPPAGPAGDPGPQGEPGPAGERGADGVVPEEALERAAQAALAGALAGATLEGRTFKVGGLEVRLAFPLYRGVWQEEEAYERGDCVTRDGSTWHCNAEKPAGKPGTADSGWQLMAKQAR